MNIGIVGEVVKETDQTCRCKLTSRRLHKQARWLAHSLLPHAAPQRITLHCTPQSTYLPSRSAMSCLFRRLGLRTMAMAKKAPDGLAANQSTRRAAAPSFAIPRAIHIPRADPYNEPCSMWTMEALSRPDLPLNAEIFNFTRGRFIDNEEHELSQRHRTFNITELARQAACVTQADRCVSIRKYPDGMYNRVLLLSMNNGKEVVAKIPNPNSGQPHFTTASEVATMKFVS